MKDVSKVTAAAPLAGLATIRDSVSKRISSWDKTGGNRDAVRIEKGETAVLGEIEGAGCVRHIWFTISAEDPLYLRKVVLRMYWDGEDNPSVETPVGDFFGVGHGVMNHFVSLPLNMTRGPGAGVQAGMNCYFPMPFSSSARIEVENQSDGAVGSFYYYLDYELHDSLAVEQGRFHAQWRRENPCQAVTFEGDEINLTGDENYLILDAQGRGHFVGCVLNVHNLSTGWFGEGDDMIFVDGEQWPPSLHGTGTEDYFCEAWGFPSGVYCAPYHGVSLAGDVTDWTGKWSLYRFHVEDPVHFKKSLRVTIEHGHANDRADDYSSVAYWYQQEPHQPFPALSPVEARLPREG